MNAYLYGYDKCVALLVQAGADVNISGRRGVTALYKTIVRKNISCVKLIIEAGADVNKPDINNNTPLIASVARPDVSFQLCMQLIKAGALINMKNNQGCNALKHLKL